MAKISGDSLLFRNPTGITYDKRDDSLWVLTYTNLIHIDKKGHIIDNISIIIEGQDQICLDYDNNCIYMTAGVNYDSEQFLYKIDLDNFSYSFVQKLQNSYAVEGIFLLNDNLYVLNDVLYHNAFIPKDLALIYKKGN